jgi:hypothetical protein
LVAANCPVLHQSDLAPNSWTGVEGIVPKTRSFQVERAFFDPWHDRAGELAKVSGCIPY